jgi:hypothetical protein
MIFAYVLPIERPKTVENRTEKAIIFQGRMVTRWKEHRLWSESGGQRQHRAQTVRRIKRRRDAADSGIDCDVAGGGLVAGRSVFIQRPFQYQSGAQGKLDSASVWPEETVSVRSGGWRQSA